MWFLLYWISGAGDESGSRFLILWVLRRKFFGVFDLLEKENLVLVWVVVEVVYGYCLDLYSGPIRVPIKTLVWEKTLKRVR